MTSTHPNATTFSGIFDLANLTTGDETQSGDKVNDTQSRVSQWLRWLDSPAILDEPLSKDLKMLLDNTVNPLELDTEDAATLLLVKEFGEGLTEKAAFEPLRQKLAQWLSGQKIQQDNKPLNN